MMALLSTQIVSAADRKAQMLAGQRFSVQIRLSDWLYRHHSIKHAIIVAFCLVAVYWLVAWLSALVWGGGVIPGEASNQMLGVVEVTGGIYTILLAVVALSVQLHAQRSDENAMMVSYLLRRHFMYWIIGIAIGVIVANAVLPWAVNGVAPLNQPSINLLNAIFFPATVFMSLWLVGCTIRDATRSTFDSSIAPFIHDMAHAIASDQYYSDLSARFSYILRRNKANYDPFRSTLMRKSSIVGQYKLPSGRFVADINESALLDLLATIAKIDGCRADFVIRPGERTEDHPALILRRESRKTSHTTEVSPLPGHSSPERAVNELDLLADHDEHVKRLLLATYILTNREEKIADELNEFLRRFGLRIRSLARVGSSVEFNEALVRLGELVQSWARLSRDTEPEVRAHPFVFSVAQFNGPLAIDLFDVVKSSMSGDDLEKAVHTSWFLARLFRTGVQTGHYRLTVKARGWLIAAYHYGAKTEVVAKGVGNEMDTILHSLFIGFDARSVRFGDDRDVALARYRRERIFLTEAIAFNLGLLNAAMKSGREQDCEHFFGRLVEHRKHGHESDTLPLGAEETSDILHDYAVLTVFSWSLCLVEAAPDKNRAALQTLDLARGVLAPAHRLVSIWEFYHAGSGYESQIDGRFGTDNWEPGHNVEYRSGVTYDRWSGSRWRKRGLLAALIAARQPYAYEVDTYFATAPERYMWDTREMGKAVDEILTCDALRIQADRRAAIAERVVKLIGSRQLVAERAHALNQARAPLSGAKIATFERAVQAERNEHRQLIRTILRALSHKKEASYLIPMHRRLSLSIPRSYFLGTSSGGDRIAEECGQFVASHETSMLAGLCRDACERWKLGSLIELQNTLDRAREALKARGVQPDLLIVPKEHWYVQSLFGKARWEVAPRTRRYGEIIGTWNELRVLEWPVDHAPVILVCNADSYWGLAALEADALPMNIVDVDGGKLVEFCVMAENARDLAELPAVNELIVIGQFMQISPLGVSDPNAGLSISVDEVDLGFMALAGDKYYHSVSCAHVDDAPDAYGVTVEECRELLPCPDCMPK